MSRGASSTSWSIASRITVGRRDDPELSSAKMAHAEPSIAGCAKGRSLIIRPVLLRHAIGGKALPPIIAVTVAPCEKTAVHTGPTELGLSPHSKSLQGHLIWAKLRRIAHIERTAWSG